MFCPRCKTEYEPWMKTCADCLVPLVESLPSGQEHAAELVTVFATGNPALLAMAKSILDHAEILYLAKGEGLQNLFGAGSIGGYNPALGPVELQVNVQDENEARELLEQLPGSTGLPPDESDQED